MFAHVKFDWQIYFILKWISFIYFIKTEFSCPYSCSKFYLIFDFIYFVENMFTLNAHNAMQIYPIYSIWLKLSFWFVSTHTIFCVFLCVWQYLFTINKKHTASLYLHVNWLCRRRRYCCSFKCILLVTVNLYTFIYAGLFLLGNNQAKFTR